MLNVMFYQLYCTFEVATTGIIELPQWVTKHSTAINLKNTHRLSFLCHLFMEHFFRYLNSTFDPTEDFFHCISNLHINRIIEKCMSPKCNEVKWHGIL